MAFTMTIGGVDAVPYLVNGSVVIRQDSIDFQLVGTAAQMTSFEDTGAAIVTTNPVWGGGAGVVQAYTIDYLLPTGSGTTTTLTMTGTNSAAVAFSGTAPTKGYSDAPDNVTYFGYRSLSYTVQNNQDGTSADAGTLELDAASYSPVGTLAGQRFLLTSAATGASALTVSCSSVTTYFHANGTPFYSLAFVPVGGDVPLPAGGMGLGIGSAFPPNPAVNHRHTRSDL